MGLIFGKPEDGVQADYRRIIREQRPDLNKSDLIRASEQREERFLGADGTV